MVREKEDLLREKEDLLLQNLLVVLLLDVACQLPGTVAG